MLKFVSIYIMCHLENVLQYSEGMREGAKVARKLLAVVQPGTRGDFLKHFTKKRLLSIIE